VTDYRPVDCDTHSRYEEAILLRRRLRLTWRTPEGAIREELVQPLDVFAREGEEFLLVRVAGEEPLQLRLDHIQDVRAE
jgi:transcriptional antiterminator Rof (Rho-off)